MFVEMLMLFAIVGVMLALQPLSLGADAPSAAPAPSPVPASAGTPTPAAPAPASGPAESAPDPLAGLSPEDRAELELLQSFSPRDRAQIVRLARERHLELAEQEKKKANAGPPAEGGKNGGPDEDPIAAMRKEMSDLKAALTAKEQREAQESAVRQMQEAERRFNADLGAVLGSDEDLKDDEEAGRLVKGLVVLSLLEHRADPQRMRLAFDTPGAAKQNIALAKKVLAKFGTKAKQEWLAAKIADATATLGEAGRGAPPSRVEPTLDADQFERGIAAEMAVRR